MSYAATELEFYRSEIAVLSRDELSRTTYVGYIASCQDTARKIAAWLIAGTY